MPPNYVRPFDPCKIKLVLSWLEVGGASNLRNMVFQDYYLCKNVSWYDSGHQDIKHFWQAYKRKLEKGSKIYELNSMFENMQ